MDIGADLFLQMLKSMYPGSSEGYAEKWKEWFQKDGQQFFTKMSGQSMMENVEAYVKSWLEGIQEALAKGGSPIGFDLHKPMMDRIIQNGALYVKFINELSEATGAAYTGEGSGEALNAIHHRLSQHLLELYQENIGRYLAAPQFGIPREALQQTNMAIASYHKLLGAAGDFLIMFSKPLRQSMDLIQQAIEDRKSKDEGFSSAKEVYGFAVKILDKAYDDWLKSPEGVQCVADIVEKYLEYKQNLNPVIDLWLKSFSIPTKKEMEEVYHSIYDLRKKARQQDALISQQNQLINTLNRKIKKLESSLPASPPKKKPVVSRSAVNKKKTKSAAGAKKK